MSMQKMFLMRNVALSGFLGNRGNMTHIAGEQGTQKPYCLGELEQYNICKQGT